ANDPPPCLELTGAAASAVEFTTIASSKFDLAVDLWPASGEFGGYLEYSTDLFAPSTVAELAADFCAVLASVLERPDLALEQHPAISTSLARWRRAREEASARAQAPRKGVGTVRRRAVTLTVVEDEGDAGRVKADGPQEQSNA